MTPPTAPHDRLTEIQAIHRDYRNFYQVLRGVVLVAVLAGIGVLIFSSDLPSYWQNIYVTIVGAIGTVLIIDQRAEQRAIHQRKGELIAQMGSRSNAFALEAVRLLNTYGWLKDGSLRGIDLFLANLQKVVLIEADLQYVDLGAADIRDSFLIQVDFQSSSFMGADCQGAKLDGSNFSIANLAFADLQKTSLNDTNLQRALLALVDLRGAKLTCTNLKDAVLTTSDMRGTDLSDANLEGARIDHVKIDETTKLPDKSFWTPDTDLSRFTDPNHPQFWRSSDPSSPAYRPPPKPSA